MFKMKTYKIRWTCDNPEVLKDLCDEWNKRGCRASVEVDEDGRSWVVQYARTRIPKLVDLYGKMMCKILRWEREKLESKKEA